jgi:hypothetical protein
MIRCWPFVGERVQPANSAPSSCPDSGGEAVVQNCYAMAATITSVSAPILDASLAL